MGERHPAKVVTELRRRLYPEHVGYLMVAEGVLPYLTAADVRQLFVRLTDRLPSGELIFDGVAGPTARMSKLFQWSLGDPWEIERWNPRLALIDVVPWSQTSNGSPTADTAPSSN